MNIIKNLDYDRYNKYINQKYLDEKNFEMVPTIFAFLCLSYIFFKLMPNSHTYFSLFLCVVGFLFILQNILYKFFLKRTVVGIFFLDGKMALKFSKFQYEYLNNIEVIEVKKMTLLSKIISHYAYDAISISSNNKKYFIPYNEEYKDELIKILSMYQKIGNDGSAESRKFTK
ncbi:hypothetical protein LU293_03380 [Moraxella nasovis]|uniref:hypothetical protein n=1 Tax=Moraxella nasovis TaxID=2904121 RepID=UPI001F606288|nr:hypothetical protein [Moraxella nasovis]UNU73951.1 hypothetical protein LU293_03380 [Moraxella nasovis]